MTNLRALVRRELGVYFVSPMAYIILTAFLIACGMWFWVLMQRFAADRMPVNYAEMQSFIVSILTLVTPLITMRLIAEERGRGTIETMLTAPVSEWQFVLAKFVSAFVFVCYLIGPSVCYAMLAAKYGSIDVGAVAAGYFGMLLAISAVLAIGLCISAMTSSQIVAGVLTLIAALLLIFLPFVAPVFQHGDGFFMRILRAVFLHVNLLGHMESFSRGIVDTQPIVYLSSVVFLFLFLAVRVLEARRW